MDKAIFNKRLIRASEEALAFAKRFIKQELPNVYKYRVYPNQSYDENPLRSDEELYPDESLPKGKYLLFKTPEDVTDHLVRNSKVPEWINAEVEDINKDFTYLALICCGRFTADEKLLYHKHEGIQPFHTLGPVQPYDWNPERGKFDLYWRKRLKYRFRSFIAGICLKYWKVTNRWPKN